MQLRGIRLGPCAGNAMLRQALCACSQRRVWNGARGARHSPAQFIAASGATMTFIQRDAVHDMLLQGIGI
jgi:hypothetical protein